MEKGSRDVRRYGDGYQRGDLFDGNNLFDAYAASLKGTSWKASVQRYEIDYLLRLSSLQEELRAHTYQIPNTTEFILNERGKTRVIHGQTFEARIALHVLCDNGLMPNLQPHFTFDNAASQKGKGTDFARRRLVKHLQQFYNRTGSNNGWILLGDFSKYYDNIQHPKAMEILKKYIVDSDALWLSEQVMKHDEVDVSYLSDSEYAASMDMLFNSLEYERSVPKSARTGEKMLKKHVNIGDQFSQAIGLAYAMDIDSYITTVRGYGLSARYSDDFYVIGKTGEELEALLSDITKIAAAKGIVINNRKTRICRLSDKWKFLKTQYSLLPSGKIRQRIDPDKITRERKKLKRLPEKLSQPEYDDQFNGWYKANKKNMSHTQRRRIIKLYQERRMLCTH